MPRSSHSLSALPSQTIQPLERLGLRLRAHRVHREWTIAEMAERLLCSPNTLRALESGKPGTSIGLLAHALWLFGEIDSMDNVAPRPRSAGREAPRAQVGGGRPSRQDRGRRT